MAYIYNDGGRAASGYKGKTGDCSVRSVCIALGLDYKEAYLELAKLNASVNGKRSVRNGMLKKTFDAFLKEKGWEWHPAPKFNGRKAKASDMPEGYVIARQAKHFVAVLNGVPQDTFDSSQKMIYGYWRKTL